eukprot:CAMPEP_0116149678 /NCGR_PEP_ID=MMETSP0329-20121206/19100_1 /TAXON_ID=697910 /ORGANISM="Pseudo-nitzschia arenysensis, Strain B593" /LENGTH=79 /DNA_ID=CAMNT_0003646057 /DNA_START=525 /DNA_END=760 /DNA_ORIENTATION=+
MGVDSQNAGLLWHIGFVVDTKALSLGQISQDVDPPFASKRSHRSRGDEKKKGNHAHRFWDHKKEAQDDPSDERHTHVPP